MEMRAVRDGEGLDPATRDRLEWLAGLCLLSWREQQILARLVAAAVGQSAGERGERVGARAGLETVGLAAGALARDSALTQWGLVRSVGARLTLNARIARFLLG
ncbi:MAG: hypothetical protein JWN44_6063 [Myxococcales bacterium]|nr:hypothetical protein [Myxococcales bacterium]